LQGSFLEQAFSLIKSYGKVSFTVEPSATAAEKNNKIQESGHEKCAEALTGKKKFLGKIRENEVKQQ
jgi:hypothetical protein